MDGKIKVKFVKFQGEVIALFPDDRYVSDGVEMIRSYSHEGQHSLAASSLMRFKKVPRKDFASLLKELNSIGYKNLHILNFQ